MICDMISFTPLSVSFFFYVIFVVYESFKDYIATEKLEGENKYDAGDNGLQVSSARSDRNQQTDKALLNALYVQCV